MMEASDGAGHICVRPATPSDAATIARFSRELAIFEKEPLENVKLDEEAVLKHAFGEKPRFEVLIAEVGGDLVGMALFFENFSTWTASPGLWIEELFVEERFRGLGVGSALISKVVGLAEKRSFGRVELAVLDWNPAADFYRMQGFERLDEWSTFRLSLGNRADR